ncbi:MAG: outer membrane lipoprotein carrier protein LolA [Bacteroidia bacterium]|nr:outer membrane lipoprotein carrier protein LolA [Bacteroidia bacterium]
MKILNICICLTFLTLAFPAAAQNDKQADKILKEVSKKYKSFKTIKASFTVTTENTANKDKKTESGTIQTKGNSFKLEFGGQEIFCNGKLIWTFTKETNEVTKDKYNPKSGGINPAEIFTIYEKGFIYKYTGNVVKNGVTIEKVKLTPKDKTKPYFQIELEIDNTKKQIQTMKVSYKNGMIQTFTITSVTPNIDMPATNFEFDAKKHPGVEVIDLTN